MTRHLNEEQRDLIQKHLMKTNDAAEDGREATPEGMSNRLKEGAKSARELGQVMEDVAERLLSKTE